PASASAPPLLSAAPLAGGVALATGSNAASESLGKAFSGDGQETLPLESLPQPPLPAPFTLGGESTNFQEVGTNAQPPNAALRVSEQQSLPFHKRFFQGYPALVTWFPKHIPPPPKEPEEPAPARRAPPSPWDSPPFPMSEYQGYPLIGVPPGTIVDPFMRAVLSSPWGPAVEKSRVEFHGWITTAGSLGKLQTLQYTKRLLDRAQFLQPRPGHLQARAGTGHGADRPHRLRVPLGRPVRHGLSLHDGRRLGQPPVVQTQQPVRDRSRRTVLRDLYPEDL